LIMKTFRGGVVSVQEGHDRNSMTQGYVLYPNYPNPFNPTTTIKYTLPERSSVHLVVYDILGRQVATVVKDEQSAGTHTVEFSSQGLPSGVYFYRLTTGTKTLGGRMVLLK
ncbi:MAG: T9SS type A sorting domain-containing protein, partial [Bacteroidota bacterium]